MSGHQHEQAILDAIAWASDRPTASERHHMLMLDHAARALQGAYGHDGVMRIVSRALLRDDVS